MPLFDGGGEKIIGGDLAIGDGHDFGHGFWRRKSHALQIQANGRLFYSDKLSEPLLR